MRAKTIQKSKYKGVSLMHDRKLKEFWGCRGNINGLNHFSKHETEIEAAKMYDIVLINNGLEPCNIIRRK